MVIGSLGIELCDDFIFGISYDDDLREAKTLLEQMFSADARVLSDPELMVVVSNLGSSSVDLTVRAWVKKDDYWPLKFELTEQVKLAFDAQGISFPRKRATPCGPTIKSLTRAPIAAQWRPPASQAAHGEPCALRPVPRRR